ncbi:MAG: ABC transporter permease [Chloroflexi bacterium]|nr:ABC transporter permease [Chloroflexota bacterium]
MTAYHIRIQPSRGWLALNLREIWAYRDLLQILALRDIQLRYKQTALGITWVILQPLLTSAIFAFIFGRLAKLPSGEVPYELFVFAGLLPWTVFSQTIQRAGQSLVKDSDLVTKVYFPRILIPLSSSLATLVDFAVSAIVFIILLLVYQIPLSLNLLALPFLLVICLLASVGVGLWISAFSVFYRDFIYSLSFIIQLWMFASPLAYSISIIPDSLRTIYSLNPAVGIIESFRWSLLGGASFPGESFAISVIVSLLIFFGGSMVFKRVSRRFADVI